MKNVNLLEKVQERATRLVDGIGDMEYPERLRKLKLPNTSTTKEARRHDRGMEALQYLR